MHIEEHCWHSPHLDRPMALKVYGHWGQPIMAFPCSRGRYFDYEGFGMIEAIRTFIDNGRVKIFCVDSVDAESWYDFGLAPQQRNDRHQAYERYIVDEVIPFIRDHCCSPRARIMANGCSMGAYHAVNFFLKRPDVFGGAIALSGLYRLDRPEFNLTAADLPAVYYNSPLTYLPGLEDAWYMAQFNHSALIVCVGQGAWEEEALQDTRALEALFRGKAIPAWVDYWGWDVNHDWPWWHKQANHFLGRLYG